MFEILLCVGIIGGIIFIFNKGNSNGGGDSGCGGSHDCGGDGGGE